MILNGSDTKQTPKEKNRGFYFFAHSKKTKVQEPFGFGKFRGDEGVIACFSGYPEPALSTLGELCLESFQKVEHHEQA